MKEILLLLLLFSVIADTQAQIRIDHAISVVSDLDKAKREFADMGFHVKEGRLHGNGLFNAHIKFGNRSSFELMTVKGVPSDAIAQEYQQLLNQAEGGVYLALTGHHHDSLKMLLSDLDIAFIETNGKLWNYLSFPSDSYLAHLFFIDYHFDPGSLDDPTEHSNEMSRIHSVTLDGGDLTHLFFENIGLQSDKTTSTFQTETGNIILDPTWQNNGRPRLLGITFAGDTESVLEINWRK